LKPARLRPQALADRKEEVRYYRRQASLAVAVKMIAASRKALDQIEHNPGMGSHRIGELLGIPDLISWRLTGFPLVWFYFERDDSLDVVRLLGERQDIMVILGVTS
jgi:toxin ParE1/3/4